MSIPDEKIIKIKILLFFLFFIILLIFISKSTGGDEYDEAIKVYLNKYYRTEKGNLPYVDIDNNNKKLTSKKSSQTSDLPKEEEHEYHDEAVELHTLKVNKDNFVNKLEILNSIKASLIFYKEEISIVENEIDKLPANKNISNAISNIKSTENTIESNLDNVYHYFKTIINNIEINN